MKKYLILLSVILIFMGCQAYPDFQSDRAYQYLIKQTEFGPRVPNSNEIELCREFIIQTLEENGAEILTQEFEVTISDSLYEGINIIGRFYPRQPRRILLAAHYDTRPWADKDSNPENHNLPISGANDAASGVAVLLEIANLLNEQQPPEYGIDLVFFDLEDMGSYGSDDNWCHGSRYFANNFPIKKPEKAILLDMVADKDLNIEIERFSYHDSPALVNEVWDIAEDLGIENFKRKIGLPIYDDHVPLLEIGINIIDIIDFDYPYWHTIEDTYDKCSAESLGSVGKVITKLVYQK